MLYDKSLEKDNCGFGLIAHIEGEPSHKVVRTAIHALARMQHRGAILADGKTGDGCGLLLQKPDRFFRIVAEERGWRLAKNYAVGMLFLNQDPEKAAASRRIVEEELQRETLSIVGWRNVPTNEGVLGEIALSSLPRIEQIFVNAPAGWRPRDMERRLFIARRRIEKRLQDDKEFYVCSLSNLVNIYKGLCMPADLPRLPGSGGPASGIGHLPVPPALLQHRSTRPLAPAVPLRRTTARSTPSPVTASGPAPVPISSRRR
jgi:glutamate synthase (NADPH/NADH) large chain